jgi:hypothetical protein
MIHAFGIGELEVFIEALLLGLWVILKNLFH